MAIKQKLIWCVCRHLKKLIVKWTGRLIRKSGSLLFLAIPLCYRTWPFNISSKPNASLSLFVYLLQARLAKTVRTCLFVYVQRHNKDVSELCVLHYSDWQPIIWMIIEGYVILDFCLVQADYFFFSFLLFFLAKKRDGTILYVENLFLT